MSTVKCTVGGRNYLCTDEGNHDTEWGQFKHLKICREDSTVIETFIELYAVKNELCGRDVPAIEVYPPKDRLIQTEPYRHLWVYIDGKMPFGLHPKDPDTHE